MLPTDIEFAAVGPELVGAVGLHRLPQVVEAFLEDFDLAIEGVGALRMWSRILSELLRIRLKADDPVRVPAGYSAH